MWRLAVVAIVCALAFGVLSAPSPVHADTRRSLGNCWTHTGVGQNWFRVTHPRGAEWIGGHMKWACRHHPRSFLIGLFMDRRIRRNNTVVWVSYGSTVHSDILPGPDGVTFRVAARCHTGTWRVEAQVILRTSNNAYRSHTYRSRARYIANCP